MGQYIFIEDNESMDDKIINLLQESLRPFIYDFNIEYDKNLIERIIPIPNKSSPHRHNQPFRCYLFFNP